MGDGAEIYAGCSSCHGTSGEGGVGYQFSQGEVLKTFPHIEDQLRWVYGGSDDYATAGVQIYGNPQRPGGAHVTKAKGVMPAQAGQLTDAQILAVVCHERFTSGGPIQLGAEPEGVRRVVLCRVARMDLAGRRIGHAGRHRHQGPRMRSRSALIQHRVRLPAAE